MRIMLFGDAHFCERSSIINKFGSKYSVRLENQIQTFNWIKEQTIKNNCEMIIGLGDFFDKSQLSDIEITAAKEIDFAAVPIALLTGNHESSTQSLMYSSTKLLETPNTMIISEPYSFVVGETEICLLPYITEADRKNLSEYFLERKAAKRVILSHNDIKGINYGPVVSAAGFEIEDIETSCDLYINGHIHNAQQITDKIYNIGVVTGQNFSENAFKHSHNVIILDTETLELKFIENPYAFNFYKIEISEEKDISILENLKSNAVCSIKCDSGLVEKTRQKIASLGSRILESRLIITKKYAENSESSEELDLSVDHLARFIECCRSTIENTKILEEEIAEVCK